jgi:hypothetical protein
MNKIILPIVLLPFLQGCMSYTEAAKKSCSEYGFVQGTPAMAQCVQTEARANQQALTKALRGMTLQNDRTVRTNCTAWGSTINCTSR